MNLQWRFLVAFAVLAGAFVEWAKELSLAIHPLPFAAIWTPCQNIPPL
jgi:hypothetical protein